MLRAEIETHLDAFALRATFTASVHEIVAVVGPNGAGKSTLLKTLAGLQPLDRGAVTVDDAVWETPDFRLPPEERSVGYVPQGGRLFPHMTVAQNVAFGIDDDLDAAQQALEGLGLSERAAHRPPTLSGGQAQLVALARALVREPTLLLLDEPLASIDVAHRAAIRRHVRRALRTRKGYQLIVTHDPMEAAALADRIVVLDHGQITQEGTMDDLRSRPRTGYVAELVGVNFYSGDARGGVVQLPEARLVTASTLEGPVIATIHPRSVSLYRDRPSGSPRNVWLGSIEAIEPSLDQMRIHITGPIDLIAEVTAEGAAAFSEGQQVWASVKATEITTNPA